MKWFILCALIAAAAAATFPTRAEVEKEMLLVESLDKEMDEILELSKRVNVMDESELDELTKRVSGTLEELETFAKARGIVFDDDEVPFEDYRDRRSADEGETESGELPDAPDTTDLIEEINLASEETSAESEETPAASKETAEETPEVNLEETPKETPENLEEIPDTPEIVENEINTPENTEDNDNNSFFFMPANFLQAFSNFFSNWFGSGRDQGQLQQLQSSPNKTEAEPAPAGDASETPTEEAIPEDAPEVQPEEVPSEPEPQPEVLSESESQSK